MNPNLVFILVSLAFCFVMISVTYTANKSEHPKALFLLFFTEMWERFSFYGMKALLMLYMTEVLFKEFKDGDVRAQGTAAAYLSLVYVMPFFGGIIADRFLGFRKSIILGGILMSIGHFVLAIPSETSFYLGLSFMICGNGFFKPNISSFVGRFYKENDPKRGAGFSIFYMGINIGALLGGSICGYLGEEIDWHLGFGLAGVFMLLGVFTFIAFKSHLEKEGYSPVPDSLSLKTPVGLTRENGFYLFAFLLVPIFLIFVQNYKLMDYVMNPIGLGVLGYLIFLAFKEEKVVREKMFAALILICLSIVFFAFFEQGGTTLNLYAKRNVNMHGLKAAMVNNAINPYWIVLLSPIFAAMWQYLGKRNLEPNDPIKFGLAFLQVALGFYLFVLGGNVAGSSGMVPLFYFVVGYLFLSTAELCISPIGLSMVTKLSPKHIVAMMMGTWFLASAFGQFFAGKIGVMMAIPTENGLSSIPASESLAVYSGVFMKIVYICIVGGGLILLSSPLIKKWMHGVK